MRAHIKPRGETLYRSTRPQQARADGCPVIALGLSIIFRAKWPLGAEERELFRYTPKFGIWLSGGAEQMATLRALGALSRRGWRTACASSSATPCCLFPAAAGQGSVSGGTVRELPVLAPGRWAKGFSSQRLRSLGAACWCLAEDSSAHWSPPSACPSRGTQPTSRESAVPYHASCRFRPYCHFTPCC